jgi:hypothetical protein
MDAMEELRIAFNAACNRRDELAARVDELERALKSCCAVMVHHMEASDRFAKLAREALNEVDKALSV